MPFSLDLNLATLFAIFVQIVIVVAYLVKTNGKATAALALAKEAHMQIAALMGSLSLLREQVAREHPDQGDLDGMEKRLMAEIHLLRKELNDFLRAGKFGTS